MGGGNKFHVVVHGHDGIQSFLVKVPFVLDTYGVGPDKDMS
jgi:hypothetical protein